MARKLLINTKEKILLSVEELIASKGVNSFSLRDVSKIANISLGTLYYFYKTKDDLIYELMIKHMNQFEEDYLSWLNRHQKDLTRKRFLEVIFYKGTKLFNRAKMHIFIINECIKENENLRTKYNELWEKWYRHIVDGIKLVYKDEEDPETLAYVFMFIIDGLVIQEVLHSKAIDVDKLIDYINKKDAKK